MITQTIGAVINIVLDPILIFGWFGMPGMGVMGAAIATVFGQMVAAVIAIIFNMRKNKDIKFKFGRFKPEKQSFGRYMPLVFRLLSCRQ